MNTQDTLPPVIVEDDSPVGEFTDRVKLPTNLRCSRRYGNRFLVAGQGPEEADIMIVSAMVDEEEATQSAKTTHATLKQKAAYLKGPAGLLFKELSLGSAVDIDDVYVTALIKWVMPKGAKPKKEDIQEALPILEAEIARVKPKIIIAMGKLAFDQLVHYKLAARDLQGGWFESKKFGCVVYPMDPTWKLIRNPETIDRFRVDLQQIKVMHNDVRGIHVERVEKKYQTIDTKAKLIELVQFLKKENYCVLSVDCEWAGNNHIDGKLRSLQIAWQPGEAAYIRFRDEKKEYALDCSYEEAGQILAEHLDQPHVKYVAHHISADLPWMHHVLGLKWYQKTLMDTEFAIQVADEHADRKLERVAMTYTDLGRYDVELLLWKKANKIGPDDGYGTIPDEIIIPYALCDVDVCIRAYPYIMRRLIMEDTWNYYNDILHPFVTDTFTSFALQGMPMDIQQMDDLRRLYNYGRQELEKELLHMVVIESRDYLWRRISEVFPDEKMTVFQEVEQSIVGDQNVDGAREYLQQKAGLKGWKVLRATFDHYVQAPSFKIRSTDHKRLWLFDVKGYIPIKSTAQKEKGIPSMPWEKVLEKKPEQQAEYNPSTDQQSLQILADTHSDDVLKKLLQLNAVGNICKGFMKEADVDVDGEVIKENGLHFWLCSDGRLHGMNSTTETGRTRSWKPNILNIPGYVNSRISDGLGELFLKQFKSGILPQDLHRYIPKMDEDKGDYGKPNIPSIRSCFRAQNEDWCFVESDYQTAEIRGLAFISGDPDLIRLVTEPNPAFAKLKEEAGGGVTRLFYPEDADIHPDQQRPDFIQAIVRDGSVVRPATRDDFVLSPDGKFVHPKHDLHWSLAEMVNHTPREIQREKEDRGGTGKVGNFCLAEGEQVLTDRGPVNIEEVRGCDLVWDGLEWAHHEGVVYQGEKEVIYYQGIWATKEHEVWVEGQENKIHLGEASAQSRNLRRPDLPSEALEGGWFNDIPRNHRASRSGLFLRKNRVRELLGCALERITEYGTRTVLQVPVPSFEQGVPKVAGHTLQSCLLASGSVSGDETALRERYSRILPPLQRTWYRCGVSLKRRIHELGLGDLARRIIPRKGLRSSRQRWKLLEREPAPSGSNYKPTEHVAYRTCKYRNSERLSEGESTDTLHGEDSSGIIAVRADRAADIRAREEKCQSRMAKTYDIVNAGPRNRFVCEGVLVSNSSAYGASDQTLERKIESDTGTKPPEGTGQMILDALARRQPVATDFLIGLEDAPNSPGFLRSESGRVRHFLSHPDNIWGISSRQKKGLLSSQGREARNFFMQESVAATAARAAAWLLHNLRLNGFQARPLTVLYDSVVTHCPVEERMAVAMLHQHYMTDVNNWKYHGRWFNYPIDTDFVDAWSAKPSKERKVLLEDPTWRTEDKFIRIAENIIEQSKLLAA